MVTPVHRFQSLNGPSVHGCPSGSTSGRVHHHQQPATEVYRAQRSYPRVPDFVPRSEEPTRNTADCVITADRPPSSNIHSSNNVTNAATTGGGEGAGAGGGGSGGLAGGVGVSSSNERPILSNDAASNRAGFFDFSEMRETELAGYRLRCGVWITFVLATGFVSVAKFYCGNGDAGLEIMIFCGLLCALLLFGCFYSTLFRRAQSNHRHQETLEREEQHIATLAAALSLRRDENAHIQHLRIQQQQLNLQLQMQAQPPPPPPPPPPPYHIAILIPPPSIPDEAPPPSYDKAMNEDPSGQSRVFIFTKDDEN